MAVNTVHSMGWPKRSPAVSILLAMADYRRQAGLRLIRLREGKGWTQLDLAHAAGVSIKTISRFENGRHDGRRATIRALAKALKVNEVDILGAPPAPLGLGVQDRSDQLDRIEATLERLEAMMHDRTKTLHEQELAQATQQETALGASNGIASPAQGRRAKAR